MSSPMGDFLKPPGFDGPTGLGPLIREGSVVTEAARFAIRRQTDRCRGRAAAADTEPGDGQPVLLVPGFMAGDWTLRGMAAMLREAGYRTYRSGIRVNVGCTRAAADRLERRLEETAARTGQKVTIVGHSLGGMLARGLAVRRPDLVAGIVSMGSPIVAPAAVHQVLLWDAEMLTRLAEAGFRGLMADDCIGGECARQSFAESREPLDSGIGFTAIYSKRDGIVDWRACLDPAAEQIEVSTSHAGMAVDPVVVDRVLEALAAHREARTAAA